MKRFEVIVIGGGIGGCEAAKIAAKYDKKVLLVEREYIGGTCLNYGCIPSKFYLSMAKECEEIQQDIEAGMIQGTVKPQLGAIKEKQRNVVEQLRNGMLLELRANHVEVVFGEAILDLTGNEKIVRIKEESFEADHVILANGSSNRIPAFDGITEEDMGQFVLTNGEIFDRKDLSGKVVVIGGGVSGIEMAYILHEFGCQVMVLEAQDRILSTMDKTLALQLQQLLRQKGINMILNCKVKDLVDGCVIYEQDGKEEVYECHHVYLSIGRKGNVESLPKELKRTKAQSFLEVDDRYRTNVPGVYAIGDINGKSMLAYSAAMQAEIAVKDLYETGFEEKKTDAIPQIIYTNPEVAYVGLTEEQAKAEGISYHVAELSMNYSGRYVIENREMKKHGMMKLLISEDEHILGGGMVSCYASEMISTLATMIHQSMTCEEVLQIVYPHPTEIEVIRDCIKKWKQNKEAL